MVNLVRVCGGLRGVEDVVTEALLWVVHGLRGEGGVREGGAGESDCLWDVRHRGHHGVPGVRDLVTCVEAGGGLGEQGRVRQVEAGAVGGIALSVARTGGLGLGLIPPGVSGDLESL